MGCRGHALRPAVAECRQIHLMKTPRNLVTLHSQYSNWRNCLKNNNFYECNFLIHTGFFSVIFDIAFESISLSGFDLELRIVNTFSVCGCKNSLIEYPWITEKTYSSFYSTSQKRARCGRIAVNIKASFSSAQF